MKKAPYITLCIAALIAIACSPETQKETIVVERDVELIRNHFLSIKVSVDAPSGRKIVVSKEGRQTDMISLGDAGVDATTVYFLAALSPIPNEDESLLHWTAHIETDSGFLGGPSEAPRRVSAESLAEVFEVIIDEGEQSLGSAFASVTVGGRKYSFCVE